MILLKFKCIFFYQKKFLLPWPPCSLEHWTGKNEVNLNISHTCDTWWCVIYIYIDNYCLIWQEQDRELGESKSQSLPACYRARHYYSIIKYKAGSRWLRQSDIISELTSVPEHSHLVLRPVRKYHLRRLFS
jgi:hypothetical protein